MPADVDDASSSRKRKRRELTPVQRALALLVRREHSRKELIRKLTERGIESAEAVLAVDKLRADGWQSDGRFGEMLVRTRVAHGQGPVRIRSELGMHGLDNQVIEAAMETFEGNWRQMARDIASSRFGLDLVSSLECRRKAADFLYRRGFDGESVRFALHGGRED